MCPTPQPGNRPLVAKCALSASARSFGDFVGRIGVKVLEVVRAASVPADFEAIHFRRRAQVPSASVRCFAKGSSRSTRCGAARTSPTCAMTFEPSPKPIVGRDNSGYGGGPSASGRSACRCEEPHAFAEIGDDEVHGAVVVEVGAGETAADVLLAQTDVSTGRGCGRIRRAGSRKATCPAA